MKLFSLSHAARTLLLAAVGLLPSTMSAMTFHMCMNHIYTQTEFYHSPFPLPDGSDHATMTYRGSCSGNWSYIEQFAVLSSDNDIGVAEADSGRTLPATDPIVINLKSALKGITVTGYRESKDRVMTPAEALGIYTEFGKSRPLILRLPRNLLWDPRCSTPNIWNGFTCVDAANGLDYRPQPAF